MTDLQKKAAELRLKALEDLKVAYEARDGWEHQVVKTSELAGLITALAGPPPVLQGELLTGIDQ